LSVLGKMFGGTVGFMVGGPLGALLGAAVGHNFDQGQSTAPPTPGTTGRDHARNVFNATVFQLMGHIAKTDGRVSEREIAIARALMDHLQFNARQRQSAIGDFTEGKQPGFSAETALETFQRACRRYPSMLQELLELLLNIAYADDRLHPQTHARLLFVAERLGIHRLQFETLHTLFRAQRWTQQSHQNGFEGGTGGQREHRTYDRRPTAAVNSLHYAYSILNLKREASPEEIKLAYRRLIRQHHPDKLASSDASPTELARATERTREITVAYERIREARGF